jgi:hypothetical protein
MDKTVSIREGVGSMAGSWGVVSVVGLAGAKESITPLVSVQATVMDERMVIRRGDKRRMVLIFSSLLIQAHNSPYPLSFGNKPKLLRINCR